MSKVDNVTHIMSQVLDRYRNSIPRKAFIDAMDAAISNGTYENIRLLSPYCNMTKREIALEGKANGVPFEHTYSCYEGRHKHCGDCATCRERKEALAGFDPTEYEL